jgi:glucose-6-phosphate dehydrogenase assembly protein OpcA
VTTLWDTTGGEVVKALAAERRAGGAVASGLVLTLIVVADETQVAAAEKAATTAASQHPCRLLLVVRRHVLDLQTRLDAEVQIGGRLGPGEAVVLRMNGRLGLHAESVVLPLLAPDAPVVTWWYGDPPDLIAHDPLGVLASRRITDVSSIPNSLVGLHNRARDYAPGDTDLAWSRITPWRGVLAGAWDTVTGEATHARVVGGTGSPSAALLAAWLGTRLRTQLQSGVQLEEAEGVTGVASVHLQVDGGEGAGGLDITLVRNSDRAGTLTRTGQADRTMPLAQPEAGDLMAEELRRLDDDPVYAAALGRLEGLENLATRARRRTHIWRDPAEEAAARQ